MDDVYPSLDEMARTALKALEAATQDSEKGFFLMIEGSRIDHAGHGNDPSAQVREVLGYDKAFGSVMEFLEQSTTEGVLVATSDHETGGLAVARRKYLFYFFSISRSSFETPCDRIRLDVKSLHDSCFHIEPQFPYFSLWISYRTSYNVSSLCVVPRSALKCFKLL